jgi:hypothetical protein
VSVNKHQDADRKYDDVYKSINSGFDLLRKKEFHYAIFIRVLKQFRLGNKSDTHAQIAGNSDIEVLKRRCPESFGQFCDDMKEFYVF